MENTIVVYKNTTGHIYFIDNSIDYINEFDECEPDYIMVWDKSEMFFNCIKEYQDKGYKLIFK